MTFFKKQLTLVIGLFLVAGSVFAQGQQQMMQQQQIQPLPADSVTDEDLETVVSVNQDLRPFIIKTQKKMQQMIQENENITLQRFQAIMQARSQGQEGQVDATEAENEAIQSLQPKLVELNKQIASEEQSLVEDSPLEFERYQRVTATIRSNQQVMQRFQSIATDTTGNQGGQGNGGNR